MRVLLRHGDGTYVVIEAVEVVYDKHRSALVCYMASCDAYCIGVNEFDATSLVKTLYREGHVDATRYDAIYEEAVTKD